MLLIRASGESRQSGSAAGDFELWLDFHGVLVRVLTDTLDALPELAARVCRRLAITAIPTAT